jgi:hypothetical protein
MLMFLLLHLGPGGKYYRAGNGAEACSLTALAMVHQHPFGMIIGYRMEKE